MTYLNLEEAAEVGAAVEGIVVVVVAVAVAVVAVAVADVALPSPNSASHFLIHVLKVALDLISFPLVKALSARSNLSREKAAILCCEMRKWKVLTLVSCKQLNHQVRVRQPSLHLQAPLTYISRFQKTNIPLNRESL